MCIRVRNESLFKMILKGACNVAFLSSVIFILVLLSESNLFRQVLAQMSELNDDQVVLKTVDAGSFRGQRKHLSEAILPGDPNELPRTYFSFKGIPYAKPPIGVELRWAEPQPVEIIKQVKVATEYTPVCSQWDPVRKRVIGAQDCLYLNVFSPYIPTTVRRPLVENMTSWTVENRNLLPVLFYVHGGEFLSGSGNFYGPERFMRENVVLVTFSYRLGLFGFLSTGDQALPGNYGLLDQIEALRWVQQNIYRFGGNPLRVAIFGNIEYLLASPRARGMFQAGILNPSSTSLFGPFKNARDPKDLTIAVAKAAGCPLENQEQMVDCLKITDVDRLVRIQHKFLKFFSYPDQGIGPVVDRQEFPVLPDKPENIFGEGRFSNVPVMVGVSAYEGFNPFFEFYVKLGQNRTEVLKDQGKVRGRLQSTLQVILGISDAGASGGEFDRIFESVWRYYFGGIDSKHWEMETDRVLWKLFRVFGDLTMQSGHRKFLKLITSQAKAPVFNYVFNHSVSERFPEYLEQRLKSLGNKERDADRTLHSSGIPPWKELYYLFEPLDFDNSTFPKKNQTEEVKTDLQGLRNFTQEDEKLSDFLVKLWVSFANYGSPKQVISKMGKHGRWQRASESSLNYYVLGPESHAMKADFRKAESLFWMSILPQIRELSEKISELEPFPLLFWIFVGLTSALIIITFVLMVLICCSRARDKGK